MAWSVAGVSLQRLSDVGMDSCQSVVVWRDRNVVFALSVVTVCGRVSYLLSMVFDRMVCRAVEEKEFHNSCKLYYVSSGKAETI